MNKAFLRLWMGTAMALCALAIHAEEAQLDKWPSGLADDQAALQRGAHTFATYCLNCHSANLMRWSRLHDIGLSDQQIKSELIFGDQRVTETMTIAMDRHDAKNWFGKTPPDLSVIIRARNTVEHGGADYVYTLLRGFYRDRSTQTGWNNVVYPSISMPHIFWQLQGPRELTLTRNEFEDVADSNGTTHSQLVQTVSMFDSDGKVKVTHTPLDHGSTGSFYQFKSLDPAAATAVNAQVADLVAFLDWMSEPTATIRHRIGMVAILYLFGFIAVGYWLNKVFWRDVH
jgi:ubiquinol-cytochrome c reductase cytochrome c1 subunit